MNPLHSQAGSWLGTPTNGRTDLSREAPASSQRMIRAQLLSSVLKHKLVQQYDASVVTLS